MTDKDRKGQEFEIDQSGRSLESTHGNAAVGGYPVGPSPYRQTPPRTLTPGDHFHYKENFTSQPTEWYHGDVPYDKRFFIDDHNRHLTRDVNDPALKDVPVVQEERWGDQTYQVPVFSGSTTNVNPFNNERMNQILTEGYGAWEEHEVTKDAADSDVRPPVSPYHPFTRTEPEIARFANIATYNRTKLPIADLEHRKGFRHLFFTRPECYVMARNPDGVGTVLSEQAVNDEDFSSSYTRFPYISSLLSPVYITGSYSDNDLNSNWNFLLSNRVTGLNTSGNYKITTDDGMQKSVEGYTVTIGKNLDSRVGSELSVSFRDTKNLEVYEFLRMLILYIYKIHKGIFAPSYNGYQYRNTFLPITGESLPIQNKLGGTNISPIMLHPYDRALDYTCSLFDIVTNEAGTKILYWCKYYGMFPTEVSVSGLNNENDQPLTNNMTVNATFRYQYKLECVNKTLIEFNYNAGITDNIGRVTKEVEQSIPFLLRDDPNHLVMKQYIGAAGMFTGSPYIVMRDGIDPVTKKEIAIPYLRFMPLKHEVNKKLNLNITNDQPETDGLVGVASLSEDSLNYSDPSVVKDKILSHVSETVSGTSATSGSDGNSTENETTTIGDISGGGRHRNVAETPLTSNIEKAKAESLGDIINKLPTTDGTITLQNLADRASSLLK